MADTRHDESDETLLAGLSATLGEPIAFDEHGQCVLLFDSDVEIALASDGDLITARSALLPLTPDRATAALSLNNGGLAPGMALAHDHGTGLLVLYVAAHRDGLTADALVALVAQIVALVPDLRARLAGEAAADADIPLGAIRG